MIKILQRYIGSTIANATGLVCLIITGILSLILLLRELKNIGEGDYGLGEAIFYMVLRLPNELYQFSPMLILLGCIIGLSILSSHRELAVMRASGFSIKQIIVSVLGSAFLLILLITALGEWAGPSLSSKAEVRKENAQNGGQTVVTATGVWFHVDNNFIHVQHVVGRQLLEGVTRYQFNNDEQLQAAYYAKSMELKNGEWQMKEVSKTTFYPERTKSEFLKEAEWGVKFNHNLLNVGLVEPDQMSLPKLAKMASYLKRNGLQASEYQFDFWKRIFQPLASLVMIFLAIPFVLGALSATTMGWRIMAGILAGFGFFILNAMLGQLCIVFQFPPIAAAFLPPLLFAFLGILLCKKLIKN